MENEVRVKTVPRSKRVAFTGYRPQKMPFGFDEQDERCVDFKKRLRDTIESFIWQGYQHFISGGALGMDMYAAEAVLDLKKQYPEIMLEMVSPFDTQPRSGHRSIGSDMTPCLTRRISSQPRGTSTPSHVCLLGTDTSWIMQICCWRHTTGSLAGRK